MTTERFPFARLPILAVVAAVVGCSSLETSVTRPDDRPSTMELRVEVPGVASAASVVPRPSASVVVEEGATTLTLSEVDVVLDQVEFRRADGECTDSSDPSRDDGDACSEVAVQPTVLELPTEQEFVTTGPVPVEAGSYEALEFDVHVVTAQDVNVLSQNPGLQGASVQVRGTFDDGSGAVPFDPVVFGPEGEVQLDLAGPIDLPDGDSAAMTLSVDVDAWFRLEGGLVDPSVAAQDTALARQVRENILASFSVRAGT